MKLSVLISCMHQKDTTIIQRSNVRTDAVVVNQCDENKIQNIDMTHPDGNTHKVVFINTTERGLSRSRNMAILNSDSDVCLIMDDDEILEDNYESIILDAHEQYKNADIIVFKFKNRNKKYSDKPHKVGFIGALRVSSIEITFKRKAIIENNINFNVKMGSGTGHGCGEENAFLFACLHKKLTMRNIPVIIADLHLGESSWFKGFNDQYFISKGAAFTAMKTKMVHLLILQFAIRKYKIFKDQYSVIKAIRLMENGRKMYLDKF